ncbi:hypothetical protein MMC07_001825 [Pseudocyphellaria aurata]|nr:hypothetical protein [Pseudocyphellaria aurata]
MAVLRARVTADASDTVGASDLEADVPLWVEREVEADEGDIERGDKLEDEREDRTADELDGKRKEEPEDEPEDEAEEPEFKVAEKLVVVDGQPREKETLTLTVLQSLDVNATAPGSKLAWGRRRELMKRTHGKWQMAYSAGHQKNTG